MHGTFVDRVIADLADRRHGVVTRRDLLEAGVTSRAIRHRVSRQRLHVVHRGVYAYGRKALTTDGRRIAAVLAAGDSAVLSHRSAAALWELRPSGTLELTSAGDLRLRPGIRVHHLPLPADEVTCVRAIPVTTVPRTLFDLAAVLPRAQVERAMNEAEVRRLTDHLCLADLVNRHRGRKGIAMIRAILETLNAGAQVTRSELEMRFLTFLRKTGLPRPEVNASLFVAGRWIECDCVWRDRRVIVELDGRASHDTAAAFERDRARDRTLQARGWRLVRITWRQLHDAPESVAYDLKALLSSSDDTAPSRNTSQVPSSS
jgi:very-short-patch-repair endonuclease